MSNIKNHLKTIFYVSKITNVNNKKLRIFISVLFSNLSVVTDLAIIVSFATLITGVVEIESIFLDVLINNSYLIPVLVIIRFSFLYIEKMNIQALQLSIRENLRMHILKEVYKKGNYSLSDATFYINELTQHIAYFYNALSLIFSALIQLTIYGFFLIYSSPQTVGIFLVGGLILFFPTRYLLQLSRKYIHISYEKSIGISQDIQRVLDNLFLIKILKTNNEEFTKFKKINEDFTSAQLKNFKFGAINSFLPNFATIFIFSILIVFFNFLSIITLEFIGVTLRFVQSLGNFNASMNAYVNSFVHLEKIVLIENNKSYGKPPVIESSLGNGIEMEDVQFSYFNSDVSLFENLNLVVEKNKHTVVTGTNGSGKSTLLGIMSGALEIQKGEVKQSSSKISYVGVNPLIIPGTLKENLLYGNDEKISDNLINKEIDIFELDIDISNNISNSVLSSGQMQKIAFIRAFLMNPEILFLDEATANLDDSTRTLVGNILRKRELTIINSTHNPEDYIFDSHIKIRKIENKSQVFNVDS